METHIFLSDKINSISIDGIFIPPYIRDFYIDDANSICIFGITDDYKSFCGEVDLVRGKGERVQLQKVFGGIMIQPTKWTQDEILYEKVINAFNKKTKVSVISGESMRVIFENDEQYVGILTSSFPEIIEKSDFCIVKDNKNMSIVTYNNDFVKSEKIPYSDYSIVGSEITISTNQETCEQIITKKKASITQKGCEITLLPTQINKKGNFCERTILIAFLERVKFCENEDIFEFMDKDNFELSDIPKLKEYLGEFDEFIVADDVATLFGTSTKSFKFMVNNKLIINISDV